MNQNIKNFVIVVQLYKYFTSLFAIIIKKLDSALQYMHENGVCHRDLKPQNIIWNLQTQELKIIDFDVSKIKNSKSKKYQMWTNTGTLHYKAPQSFIGGYSQKVDIWSLGVIAFQLLVGRLPYSNQYENRLIKMICQARLNFGDSQICSQGKQLIQNLLNKQASQRISANQIELQPFIQKIINHIDIMND